MNIRLFTSRLTIMRKFAIASLLVAGMAFTGSLLAQDAAPQPAPAAPAAAKPASATPAPAASSSHKHKKNKDNNGQPKPKGSKSAKRTAKSTLPQTEASH